MSHAAAAALGAIAGATIFIGLPIGRIRGISRTVQGFLNAVATGVLLFLLWDILSHAAIPVETALAATRHGDGSFAALVAIFAAGLGIGLLGLVYFNARLFGRTKNAPPASPRTLAMMIATGLGLHNLSEGLAIGQSAATGAVAFALVLVIGFSLHNITEGFAIAAPLATDGSRPSWSFLLVAGLIGGAPTFLGTVVGYIFTSTYIYVLFLALAAGALLYVINEMFHIGRRLNSPAAMAWGLLIGFLLAYGTDLFLTYVAA
ncbi:MAG TPA: ZIP family metal transporter [Candidatus Dormibacteraeota bacterium]|nr:ZIP family metal transporter [Candidatus Dormibacteraeota bacterium]